MITPDSQATPSCGFGLNGADCYACELAKKQPARAIPAAHGCAYGIPNADCAACDEEKGGGRW